MAEPFQEFVDTLGASNRVVLLGGLAIIAHGLSRPTKDADIWLEPMEDENSWSDAVFKAVDAFSRVKVISLLSQNQLTRADLPGVIGSERVVRVCGLSADIDVFRIPHNLETGDFDSVWERAKPWADKMRVIDSLDLLVTKSDTGRDVDQNDVYFLENIVRRDFGKRLAVATPEEARNLLDRYADHSVCERAMENPDPKVREMARQLLTEFADNGDPFASDFLRNHGA